MYLDNDRRPTLTPQLAVRVALFGGIALAAFAVIFFRLWFLQVLSSDAYVQEARGNQLREIRVQPPRGDIVDREGRVLVDQPRRPGGRADAREAAPRPSASAWRSTGASAACSRCARARSSGA